MRFVLLLALLCPALDAHAATFTVTSTANSGTGSLRQAILDANASPGPDVVTFNIPGPPGSLTIAPITALPTITGPVTIDGYTQPLTSVNTAASGTNAVLRIVLSGSASPADTIGLGFGAGSGGSLVRGLVINGFDGLGSGVGVRIFAGIGTNAIAIEGCFIGTNAQGTAALPNGAGGVSTSAAGTRVGGSTLAERNLISGNERAGVFTATGSIVRGNLIGTQANGVSALGNRYGIVAGAGTIGGSSAADANVIAHNVESGVRVCGTGVTIERNRIFANGALGIDLEGGAAGLCGGAGVTPNDRGDADVGNNDLQNTPVLMTSWFAPVAGGPPGTGRRQVTGYLDSTPNRAFRVELFVSASADASGFGEGEQYLGSIDITTNTDGYAWFPFALQPAGLPLPNEVVTATATDLVTGATSEFARAIPTLDGLRVTTSADSGPGSLRNAIAAANAGSGRHAIVFELAAFSIRPSSALPAITQNVVIDGFTQPGARPNFAAIGSDAVPLVELDGSLAGSSNGLAISAPAATVRGLTINNFAQNGVIALSTLRLEGNHIGTDRAGTTARPNAFFGVDLGSTGSIIGGSEAPLRNLVSGNLAGGVRVLGADTTIVGNVIGRTAQGAQALPNGGSGVSLYGTGARVGGVQPGEGNWIAGNTSNGVLIGPSAGSGNQVIGNAIHGNGALGIDLGGDGPTANDVDDADVGPNAHQNAPVLALASLASGVLEVRGSLDRPPIPAGPRSYVLDVFDNDACDAAGRGEGQRPLGAIVVAVDLDEGFVAQLPGVAGANVVTATVTESPGSGTSELSNCVVATRADALFADSFEGAP